VAVKIKLKRMGKIRAPYYRIVVADARTKRDGRAIEEIGKYHPKEDPSLIQVDSARVQYWLGVGAQPTESVLALLRKTGDWQQFRGEPAPEPLRVAAPKPDRRAVFEAAARESAGEPAPGATTPRTRRAPRRDEAAAEPADASTQAAPPEAATDAGASSTDADAGPQTGTDEA
jgi:small subunit ribosomal protein S16